MRYIWVSYKTNPANLILFVRIMKKAQSAQGGQKCPWGRLKNFGMVEQVFTGGQTLDGGGVPPIPHIGQCLNIIAQKNFDQKIFFTKNFLVQKIFGLKK